MFKQQGLYSGDKREETWLSFSKLLPLLCFGKDNCLLTGSFSDVAGE